MPFCYYIALHKYCKLDNWLRGHSIAMYMSVSVHFQVTHLAQFDVDLPSSPLVYLSAFQVDVPLKVTYKVEELNEILCPSA